MGCSIQDGAGRVRRRRPARPGSLGCDWTEVTTGVIHDQRGRLPSTFSCSSASSAARHRPMLRSSPTGRHSLTRCPAAANSPARTASAARRRSTSACSVPSGTVVVSSTRNSFMDFLSLHSIAASGGAGQAQKGQRHVPPTDCARRMRSRSGGQPGRWARSGTESSGRRRSRWTVMADADHRRRVQQRFSPDR